MTLKPGLSGRSFAQEAGKVGPRITSTAGLSIYISIRADRQMYLPRSRPISHSHVAAVVSVPRLRGSNWPMSKEKQGALA